MKRIGYSIGTACFLFSASYVCAAYDETDPFKAYAEVSWLYDSNIFRLGENSTALDGNGNKDDMVIKPHVGASYDLKLSRQRFYVQGDFAAPHYLRYSQIDYTSWNSALGWDWQLGDDWNGKLAYSDSRALSAFENVTRGERDLRSNHGLQFSMNRRINSNVSLQANANQQWESHNRRTYLDLDSHALGMGLMAATDSGSSATWHVNWTDVAYRNDYLYQSAASRAYQQWSNGLDLVWPVSEKLRLTANASLLSWRFKQGGSNNRDTTMGAGLSWTPTSKTLLSLDYQRQLDSPGENAGRSQSDSFSIKTRWDVTEKIALDALWRLENKRLDPLLNAGESAEKTREYRLGLTWKPRPFAEFSAYTAWQDRSADLAINRYKANQVGMNLRINF